MRSAPSVKPLKNTPVECYKFQGLAFAVPNTLAFGSTVWLTPAVRRLPSCVAVARVKGGMVPILLLK